MTILKYSVATILISVPALAQTNGTYLLTSTNTVSPSSPTTTVSIWATWDGPFGEHGIGVGDYDLTAGDGLFSNAVNVLRVPGSTTGIITGNVITGAVNGQIFFPGFTVGTDNPILIATYDWTATDFTPRTVPLDTNNTIGFSLIVINTGGTVQLYPDEFTPGSGVISVVPAPAAWFALALPLFARRRRPC